MQDRLRAAPADGIDSRLLASAAELKPLVSGAADQAERERRLPRAVVEAFADAGLFRMLVPRSLGGAESNVTTYARVVEEIAKVDGSTAWCLSQGAGSALIAAYLDHDAASEIFGDRGAVMAWGPGKGTFIETQSGYRLTGRWSFASGCHHATWLGGFASMVDSNGKARLGEDGLPILRRLLFPATSVHFIDIWNVSGLRGTGSDGYEVADLEVPRQFSYLCDAVGHPRTETRHEAGRLYAFPTVYPLGFAGLALGLARSTIDAFVELAATKTPRGASSLLSRNAVIQSHVARAEAMLRAARLFLYQTAEDAWAVATSEGLIPTEHRVLIRLASTHAIQTAAQTVDTVYQAAGATAIFADQPFERRFRDIHAVTQQVQGNPAHFESVGQFFLGNDPDMTWM
jgi:alkylation response protein AidB-like acyl-CoA dehydrogenase